MHFRMSLPDLRYYGNIQYSKRVNLQNLRPLGRGATEANLPFVTACPLAQR